MREIKFRAWDISKKCFIPMEVYAIITTDFNAFGVMLKDWENYKEGEYFYDNSQVLSQFTGLQDKNGVDIYEGDIVKLSGYDTDTFFRVDFEDGCFVARVPWKPESSPELKYYIGFKENIMTSQVIGNIYQNPELLK